MFSKHFLIRASIKGCFWLSKCNDASLNWRYRDLLKSRNHDEITFLDEIHLQFISAMSLSAMLSETWYLETWNLEPGIWNLTPATWDTCYLAPGTWNLTSATWHLESGTWNLAPNTEHLATDTCLSNLPAKKRKKSKRINLFLKCLSEKYRVSFRKKYFFLESWGDSDTKK